MSRQPEYQRLHCSLTHCLVKLREIACFRRVGAPHSYNSIDDRRTSAAVDCSSVPPRTRRTLSYTPPRSQCSIASSAGIGLCHGYCCGGVCSPSSHSRYTSGYASNALGLVRSYWSCSSAETRDTHACGRVVSNSTSSTLPPPQTSPCLRRSNALRVASSRLAGGCTAPLGRRVGAPRNVRWPYSRR
jgi:hypothetical protein